MFQPEHPIGVKKRRNNVPAGTSAINHGKGEAVRARRSATAHGHTQGDGKVFQAALLALSRTYASKLELSSIHPSMENNGEHKRWNRVMNLVPVGTLAAVFQWKFLCRRFVSQ